MSGLDLVKILDLNDLNEWNKKTRDHKSTEPLRFRQDKFTKGEEHDCIKSISWKSLDKINKRGDYINKLNEIKTNPKYESFIQLYFHAGDIIQFQKYGLLNSRLLSYPRKSKIATSKNHMRSYNGYNLDTTYHTFLYLFKKVKKGIYVSIKDNKLQTYLPFSNHGYINNWANVLRGLNPADTVESLEDKYYNVSDAEFWYANNCFFTTTKLKFTSDDGKGKGKGQGKGGGGGNKGKGNKGKGNKDKGNKGKGNKDKGNKGKGDKGKGNKGKGDKGKGNKGKGKGDKGKGESKEYLQEGDKTEVPFKYFLKNFLDEMNEKGKRINDMDFFFSPRDFPVFRKGWKEPYDKLLGNKVLEKEYHHETYTPILSQCTNTDFNDIPIPTQDDMMRITDDIYPDDCKNNHSNEQKFEMDWSKKINKAVFRGSATGCGITVGTNMRLKSAYFSASYQANGKDILDAKLTSWNAKPKADAKLDTFDKIKLNKQGQFECEGGIRIDAGDHNFMKLEEQSKHKYILNIDGHVKAFRLGNELRMGSVVLLVDSPYKLWFQDKLKRTDTEKGKIGDYVPIKDDLEDLEKQINWCIENDDKCEKIAQNSLDFYNKYLSKEGMYDYFYKLLNDLSKIRKNPTVKKITDRKLNICVAYRDPGDEYRKRQLDIFKEQMTLIFDGRIDYHIYIIEQESDRKNYDELPKELKQKNSKMAKFNLGILKNIGFIKARENSSKKSHYILSDVDLLPSNELLNDYLRYPESGSGSRDGPIHLGNKGTRYLGNSDSFLGGVLSVNYDDFIKSNGYPNDFWGWGGEDDALKKRFDINNIKIQRPKGSVIDLEELSLDEKLSDLKQNESKEYLKREKLTRDKEWWNTNGLNSLDELYKIISEEQYGGSKNISHYKVYLKAGDEELSDKPVVIPPPKEDYKPLLEGLYEEYRECQININSDIDVQKNKKKIKQIRIEIDNRDLDDVQLEELKGRDYLSYPDYNNPSFVEHISQKAEFNLNKITLNKDNQCDNDEFELANHQRLLKNFINNNTPYKSLLLFHGVGVGKTCSGVTISESFRDIYVRDNKKIIIVRKGGLSQGWKDTIYEPEKGDNQCAGQEFIDTINIGDNFNTRDSKTIKREQNKLINKYYEFYQYGTFSSKIKDILGGAKSPEEIKYKVNRYFSNRLLIVDEYHNLRENESDLPEEDEGGNKDKGKGSIEAKRALLNLKNVIKYSTNLRIIFLTATPMFNNATEIFLLLNLMLLNDNRPTMKGTEYINKEGLITKEGKTMINKKCRGYISYLRGENPINFPIRLYPNDELTIKPDKAPLLDLFSRRIEQPLKFLITYKNKLKGRQAETYKKYLDIFIGTKDLDGDGELKVGINKQLPQICNIAYPSKDSKNVGKDGFKGIFTKSGKSFKYKKDHEQILKGDDLGEVSIKIKNILKNIKSSEGIIFVYTGYIWSGAVPLGIALEHIGFNKFNGKNLLDSKHKDEPLNYDMESKSKLKEGSDFKMANYIILSGNDIASGDNDNELKILKSEDNKNGEKIKVVIGSSITGEGIDFKNIREIHIMEPWYHLNKLEQIVGRGIRFCSHSMLEKSKHNVTVFLHSAVYNDQETIDHYNYRLGERKSVEIGNIEMILKRNALDCYLFKDGNVIKKSDVTPMKILNSKGKESTEEVYDKKYTKICSFQNTCDYECINVDTKYLDNLDETDLNYDTFNLDNFDDMIKIILNYISELFQKKNYFPLNEIIEHIQYYKNINKFIIYNSLKDIIDNKKTIFDINKNKGYIISRGDYYIFQPLFNNDESIPMFYRNTMLKNKTSINIKGITSVVVEESSNSGPVESDAQNVLDELFKDYEEFIKPYYPKGKDKEVINVLNDYDLLEPNDKKFKTIYCGYLLDKLPYNKRKVYIEFLLNNGKPSNDISDENMDKDEINTIAYHYFSHNFIYKKGIKKVLFEFKGEPAGYFISVESIVVKIKHNDVDMAEKIGKSLEYYRKDGEEYTKIDIIKSDVVLKTYKTWMHSYWDVKLKPAAKFIQEPGLGKQPASIKKQELTGFIIDNLDDNIFPKIPQNKDILNKKSIKDLFILLEIMFRIKDIDSKDIRYFLPFDLIYHKLK